MPSIIISMIKCYFIKCSHSQPLHFHLHVCNCKLKFVPKLHDAEISSKYVRVAYAVYIQAKLSKYNVVTIHQVLHVDMSRRDVNPEGL